MSEEQKSKFNATIIGGLTLATAAAAVYFLAFHNWDDKKKGLNGDFPKLPGKSNAASEVLHLMDKDYDYA